MNKEELIYAVKYFVAVIFTGLALGILFALIKAPLESYDHESVNIPEEKSEYVAQDPCALADVVCDGETVEMPFPDPFEGMSPCAFTTSEELGCTAHERSKMMVTEKIIDAALLYDVDVDTALRIADCESDFDWRAQNPNSSAKGIYQFTDTTWEWIKAEGHQFDVDENIKNFMIWYPIYPSWWVCQ
jgi:hypothetical protein